MHRFTVIKDFHCEELHSWYMKDMSYQANDTDEKLLALIPQWIEEGKVRLGGPAAILSGGGEVVEEEEVDEEEEEVEAEPKAKAKTKATKNRSK
jgi:hypothetical protein